VTKVKICGLTREEDVVPACELGASLVGFNFSSLSPREIDLATGKRLARSAAAGALRVGVFVRESIDRISDAVAGASLDLVQIHRELSEEDLASLPVPVIAVAPVGERGPRIPPAAVIARCRALLFDRASVLGAGGTGRPFDWNTLAGRSFPAPVFVAGGLSPETVGVAIRRVRPAGVDVASGVESQPGVKDPERMRRFFEEVIAADRDQDA
jgi:phosphoribosylanthranilate isomerase